MRQPDVNEPDNCLCYLSLLSDDQHSELTIGAMNRQVATKAKFAPSNRSKREFGDFVGFGLHLDPKVFDHKTVTLEGTNPKYQPFSGHRR